MLPLARAVALSLAAFALPSISSAAGLGRLTVLSGLGQPLRAEVEISALSKDEAATIAARLGTPEAFRQAGLEPGTTVSGFRFAIDRRSDGRAFVVITSPQPVNEPFVDLVVELNWASGRFVRGYTFLLDPPEIRASGRGEVFDGVPVTRGQASVPGAPANRAQEPVSAPASARAPAQGTAAAAAPVQPPVATSVPTPAAATAPTAPAAAAGQSRAAPRGGERIVVAPGESLHSIAARLRPESLTLDQVMVAIYRANPGAFSGRMSVLRADAKLIVPDLSAMSETSAADARALIEADIRDEAAQRARIADAPPVVPPAPASAAASGAVVQGAQQRAPAARDQLKLSGPDSGSSQAPAGRGAAPAAGASGSADSRGGDVQGKLVEIEKSIADMQRLLELKNRQLSDLLKQLEEARNAGRATAGSAGSRPGGVSAGTAVATAPDARTGATAQTPSTAQSAPVQQPAASGTNLSSVPGTPPSPAPAASTASAIPAPGPGAARAPVPGPAPEASPRTPAAPSQVRPAPPPEPEGFVEDLLSQPFTLPALGAVLLLIVGYGWYALRRRRRVERFDDSLVAPEGLAANSLFGATGGQSVDTSGQPFSGAGGVGADIHAAEVDPIAEAEVYIAYGREAQAEEILREALARQPERQALRAKLLEIYANRRDVAAFNQSAGEMYAATGGRNEEWAKVISLGATIDPGNALYGTSPPAGAPEPDVRARLDAALAPPDASPRASGEPVPTPAPPQAERPVIDFAPLDFDLGPTSAAAAPAQTAPVQAAPVQAAPVQAAPAGAAPAGAPPASAAPASAAPEPTATTPAAFALEVPTLEVPALEVPALEVPATDAAAPVGEEAVPAVSLARPAHDERGSVPVVTDAAAGMSIDFEPIAVPPVRATAAEPAAFAATRTSSGSDLEKAIDGRFELPSLDLPAAGEAPPSAEPRPPAEPTATASDFSSMTFDLVPPVEDVVVQDSRSGDSGTRLDLAAAFLEIGDKAGARELIEQVLAQGNDEQQRRAREMLGKLG